MPHHFTLGLDPPKDLKSRPRDVERLRRYWGTPPRWWPVPNATDSAWPLYLYYRSLFSAGQTQVAAELLKFLRHSAKLWRRSYYYVLPDAAFYADDHFRKLLKDLSAFAYPLIFSHGPAWMLLTHLHALNAKSPYTVEQVQKDVDNWVSNTHIDTGEEKKLDETSTKHAFDEVFSQWPIRPLSESMTFKDFCNDPMRWGTSGGAPPVSMYGKNKIKSKWAWGLKQVAKDDETDLLPPEECRVYEAALKCDPVATIALKEEAQKTREIITTPMDSYLRQSYLLFRRGPVPLPSPISSPHWLPSFEQVNPAWYGCIDGERFDHSVPFSVIKDIIMRLGGNDPETAQVARDEVCSLEKLKLQWRGMTWDYKGGLLSGWRLTSLMGSLVSYAAGYHIKRSLKMMGAIQVGVMGDDIVLTSNIKSTPSEKLVDAYNNYGLKANLKKTVSGPQGEFLRKVRSPGGSWAFPSLDMKTVTHAAPWISNTQFSFEEECATAWHIFLSRMLPHSREPLTMEAFVRKHTIHDLTCRFGSNVPWDDWLSTPMSAGGGGYMESSDPKRWVTINKKKDVVRLTPFEKLGAMVGALPCERQKREVFSINKVCPRALSAHVNRISVNQVSESIPYFKRHVNVTRSLYRLLSGALPVAQLNELLTFPLPHRLRSATPYKIAEILTTGDKNMSSLPSIQHTREAAPGQSKILQTLTKQLMARGSCIPKSMIKPVATVYCAHRYRATMAPYGTW